MLNKEEELELKRLAKKAGVKLKLKTRKQEIHLTRMDKRILEQSLANYDGRVVCIKLSKKHALSAYSIEGYLRNKEGARTRQFWLHRKSNKEVSHGESKNIRTTGKGNIVQTKPNVLHREERDLASVLPS